MDFIEQIFGFSPDDGSGALELFLILAPLAGIVVLAWRRRMHEVMRHVRRAVLAASESGRRGIVPDPGRFDRSRN
jgi:hypothetical protein